MKYIERILDRYTMYQVVVTVLTLWVFAAFVLSSIGLLTYSLSALLFSLLVVSATSIVAHYFLKWRTNAPANIWSTVITALILFLLFTPTIEVKGLLALATVSFIAVSSKYVISYRHLHIVNPVVLAAVVSSLFGFAYASWWIGSATLFPYVLLGSLAIVLKVRRVEMVSVGIIASITMSLLQAFIAGDVSPTVVQSVLLSSPLIFFMAVMVTEPLTTPAGTKAQVLYGIFIGLLSNIPFTIGPMFNSPELSLLIANTLVYPLSLRGRIRLVCNSVTNIAHNTYEFAFTTSQQVMFKSGQYLEWALPHSHPDRRGTRRYFTIASSPTEKEVKLAVRMAEKDGSSYKQTLANFKKGDVLHATQLAGNFVLSKDVQLKSYVFIAGGIGITPFRSQLKYRLDTKQPINAHLFYCNNAQEDIAYRALLKRVQNELGVGVTHALMHPPDDWDDAVGHLTSEIILGVVSDIHNRIVYISGPPAMVGAYKKLCITLGVPRRNIHIDYFPGLA